MERAVLEPKQWFQIGETTFEFVAFDEEEFLNAITGIAVVKDPRPQAPVQAPAPNVPPPPPVAPGPLVPRGVAQMAAPAVPMAPVIIADADPQRAQWLHSVLVGRMVPQILPSGRDVLNRLRETPRAVVIIGDRLQDMPGQALMNTLLRPDLRDRVDVLTFGPAGGSGQPAANDPIFYRLTPTMRPQDIASIVASAARASRLDAPPAVSSKTTAWAQKVTFDICAAVGIQSEASRAATALEEGMRRLVNASRVACLFYDDESGQLWSESTDGDGVEASAIGGIVGFVARTGSPVHAPIASSDPRYVQAVDDPSGRGDEAILAVPAAVPGGQVHAVLVAVRPSTQGYFLQKECDSLAQLGTEMGPILHRFAAAMEAEEVLKEQAGGGAMQLYRQEVVAAREDRQSNGEVIRVTPLWSRWMYWVLLGLLLGGILFIAVGEISQYSTGPSVIRQGGRTEITAMGPGAIKEIEVAAGAKVEQGQILARLSDLEENADFLGTRKEFHDQLRNRLLDPTDDVAASQLRSLRRQLEGSAARVEQRIIRAPHDGIVSDVAVDVGQHVAPGDIVMAVVEPDQGDIEVIAFVPGGDRPQLEVGMDIKLELSGFNYAYQDATVNAISEGVLGPAEAAKMLGPQLAGAFPIEGPVVMVRATLPTKTFESDGEVYPYHDGMGGVAQIRLRDETILEMIVPALKEL